MKIFLALCCLAAVSARAGTAYDALGAVGKLRGEKTLDQVTEVRGTNGAPQPREWLIVVSDRDARNGVRELGVQGGKIVSERTPAGRTPGALMNMNQLNLDSDGAQTIAEREAKKAGFAYDYADFTLRAATHGGAPVWELHLIDQKTDAAATLIIAADKGTLLSAEGFEKAGRPEGRPPEGERTVVREPDRRPPSAGRSPSPGLQRVGDHISNFFERVGRHMERRKDQISDGLHNLFTGDDRHTAGPHTHPPEEKPAPPAARDTTPPPPPSRIYRDANGTEFYRPRD